MKIAVCVSGSFRSSNVTLRKNLQRLSSAGHQLDLYAHVQFPPTDSVVRNAYDSNPYSLIGRYLPFVRVFRSENERTVPSEQLRDTAESVTIQLENRTFDQILSDLELQHTWDELFVERKNIPRCGSNLRPHEPHFRNTLFMLENMRQADSLRAKSQSAYDGVLRLRPDFLISEDFVEALDPTRLVVPIRNSGREFDYGWGHMSDQCFFCSPDTMTQLVSVVDHLKELWDVNNVFVPESFSAPFLYGDVILCYWKNRTLNVPTLCVRRGGDLVREKQDNVFIGQPEFRKLRRAYVNWLDYNKQVSLWQKTQRAGKS